MGTDASEIPSDPSLRELHTARTTELEVVCGRMTGYSEVAHLLSRGPAELAATKQMQVKMKDRLARAAATV